MIHASEEAEDKYSRIAVERGRRIPPVPDLRFEYSYLRGVSQYVSLERVSAKTGASEKGKEKAVEGEEAAETLVAEGRDVVHIRWGPVLWVTTRDQVISPLLQGALWGVASHFLRPFGALLGAHVRAWWAKGGTRSHDAAEGNGVQWLRNRVASILTPTAATHSSYR
ncbi:hypothetical protein C8Q74DRAFT_1319366 [Fomes fomentarius]|nr:hypothetical protein C8Q74DRAFT_1319366 [Fomes fomentarius]